ncbi:hypothetical protein PAXINDRAFT_9323 [Paxillus involutus ATCC 200175]|nr:hypothetical protein PAXINDRAFT_9323 [Paxillus involutus ATCC 200175]
MRSQDELGEYLRKFMKISAPLIANKKLADTEQDVFFLDGFPRAIADWVHHHLSIIRADLHPDDAYPMEDVMDAAKFLLTGAALRELLANPQEGHNHSRQQGLSSAPRQPSGVVVKQEYSLQVQRAAQRHSGCAFCRDLTHYLSECEHVITYLQAGKIIQGPNGRLCMPDGGPIPRVPGCNCMKESIDRLADSPATGANTFTRDPPPHMRAGILTVACPEGEVELEIEPSAFVDDPEQSQHLYSTDPDFQPYFAKAWESYQADRTAKEKPHGKRVHFDGVEIPTRPSGQWKARTATVEDEIVSPDTPSTAATSAASAVPPVSSSSSSGPVAANPLPPNQYRYSFALEDKTAPKWVLERVLEASIPVPVKDLFAVSPDFRKQFRDMTTTKRVTAPLVAHTSMPTVYVHELSGRNPGSVAQEYGDWILKNDDGLIVAHHSLPLRCLEPKVNGMDKTINCVLDSGSEIIAMPRRVWEFNCVNTQMDTTLGVLENLRLNFDMLLGRPFHCLMSATTDDFPDGSQNITLHNPNSGNGQKVEGTGGDFEKRC